MACTCPARRPWRPESDSTGLLFGLGLQLGVGAGPLKVALEGCFLHLSGPLDIGWAGCWVGLAIAAAVLAVAASRSVLDGSHVRLVVGRLLSLVPGPAAAVLLCWRRCGHRVRVLGCVLCRLAAQSRTGMGGAEGRGLRRYGRPVWG
jgi:hypothetical protein